MLYPKLIFPILARMDPEGVHDRLIRLLEWSQENNFGQAILRRIAGPLPESPVEVFDLKFPNVLGLAAGFDKDASVVQALGLLGFGHVEVGTVTPELQTGNPKPRVFRLREDQGIINRMGFPNSGIDSFVSRLNKDRGRKTVLGASIGKQKGTPLEQAHEDYALLINRLFEHVDYFAINVSSPNTPRLRELQKSEILESLLKHLKIANIEAAKMNQAKPKPLLLKISPDLSWEQVDIIIDTARRCELSGLIATNTTTKRDNLVSGYRGEIGGLSGKPLAERSTEIINYIARLSSGQLPIIGVGGVFSQEDVKRKLDAGAILVQIYTGLIYQGPGLVGNILRSL